MGGWGGLLTVVGGAGQEGFGAWQEDLKQKEKTRLEKITAAAELKRQKDLARFRSGLRQEEQGQQNLFTTKEREATQKFKAGESKLTRASAERIAETKRKGLTVAEKLKLDEAAKKEAIQNLYMTLGSMGAYLEEDEKGRLSVLIPADKDGKPKDIGVLKAIDEMGFAFRTSKPEKTEANWVWPDKYGIRVYIGGRKGKGLLQQKGTVQNAGLKNTDSSKPEDSGKTTLDQLLEKVNQKKAPPPQQTTPSDNVTQNTLISPEDPFTAPEKAVASQASEEPGTLSKIGKGLLQSGKEIYSQTVAPVAEKVGTAAAQASDATTQLLKSPVEAVDRSINVAGDAIDKAVRAAFEEDGKIRANVPLQSSPQEKEAAIAEINKIVGWIINLQAKKDPLMESKIYKKLAELERKGVFKNIDLQVLLERTLKNLGIKKGPYFAYGGAPMEQNRGNLGE